jgi:quercetin dioxygenase-like cupin family protein
MSDELHRPALDGFRWQGLGVLEYKPTEGGAAPFSDVTRQLLFAGIGIDAELRYFEIGPGGLTTLERHQHVHAVVVLRGNGACLLGDQIKLLATHDLVTIPAMTWHQFRAPKNAPMGFLCLVNADRDRPQLPGPSDLASLRQNPELAAFIRT